jgi:hypothetical protein
VTTKDNIEKLFQETQDKMLDPKTNSTVCTTLMLDFADKASVLLPDLFKEYERLEKDLAASKSYTRWLDKQYHAAHENAIKTLKGVP